ncbi:hypothetical protein BDN71DRAFT_862034 [Pleurotus eryngii]|uniref:Secreted protein n=1 Tax=Pleurotus eryngii TaxID=5323 RepID=A0A9P5ZX98_PLEER|nr:hypothetical protein BDN71DRAFT_862034 [Pleurotus eryngii]
MANGRMIPLLLVFGVRRTTLAKTNFRKIVVCRSTRSSQFFLSIRERLCRRQRCSFGFRLRLGFGYTFSVQYSVLHHLPTPLLFSKKKTLPPPNCIFPRFDSPYSLFPLLPALFLRLTIHCPVTVPDPAPDLISSFSFFYVYVSNPDVLR